MTEQHPDPSVYWKHRRRLAYTAMAALLVTLAAALFIPLRDSAIPLLEGLAWVFGVIVVTYYGGNAIESLKWSKR